MQKLKQWARQLKKQIMILYYAVRDPRMPWYARLVAAMVAAYALSPIDLIPDFIPVLGYLDDVILLPIGIWLALKLIPMEVRREAAQMAENAKRPVSKLGAAVIILVWVVGIAAAFAILW
ncbi:YkvA family protein [Neobacillus sp. YIM B06451]|uniref:YkvA family protein n=1 Tax=Neobacillus sp. YIM B06451 TaxID=3070994 RepID=UPI002930115A|nr:YkvA family protein [Neobacillus sp. YIM B06451]